MTISPEEKKRNGEYLEIDIRKYEMRRRKREKSKREYATYSVKYNRLWGLRRKERV